MAKSVIANAFKIHSNMMTASGVWPYNNPSLYYRMKTLLSWLFSLGLCLTMWMEAINDINDFTKLSEILYIMVTITAYIIKLTVFTYRKKEFLATVNFLKDPIFMSYPEELDHYMAKTIKYSTLIANIYRYLVGCCVVLYLVYPMLDNTPLPFPFPYDTGKYRYLMYAFQLIGESYSAWNNSCLDTLCTSLMGIGAAQLDILCEKIIRLGREDQTETENFETSKQRDKKISIQLTQCIQHHLAIIKHIESVEKIFTIGLLVQFLTSIIGICNTLFHFVLISISSQFFMLANYAVIILVQLFIYCWYGNEIILKSQKVGEACYTFQWYKYGIGVRKYIFIMMERSKRPLQITVMKFTALSLIAFLAVLRWSYSCLALLLKMYYKRPTN